MISVDRVVTKHTSPRGYTSVYPFSITLHEPGAYPLSVAEEAAIKDALVIAAYKIRLMRGGGEGDFAWVDGDNIDWTR